MAENKQRESFTFYKSFEDGICHLSDAEQLQVYRAISRYSLFGERPALDGYAGMAWAFIEPILRKSRIGFENGVKGSEYGKLGGNPNFQKGKRNPYYQDNPQDNPKRACITDTDTDTDTEKRKKSVARFTPPTLQEVRQYIAENGYNFVDADLFYNHYEANGWKVGKNTMKDWRASVRGWQSREKKQTPQQSVSTTKSVREWTA